MRFGLRVLGSFWAQVIQLLAGAVAVVLVARTFGPSGAGAYTLAVNYGLLAVLAGTAGVDLGIIYFAGRGQLKEREIAFAVLCWGALWGCAVTGLALLASLGLMGSLLRGLTVPLLLAANASIPFALVARYLRSFLLGRSRILAYNAVLLVVALANLLLVAAALGAGLSVTGAVWAYAAANAAGCLLAALLVPVSRGLGVRAVGAIGLRSLLAFGLRAQASNVLQFFSYRLDLAIVNALLGLTFAGYYAASTLLAESLWYLPNAVAVVLTPRVAGLDEAAAEEITPLICRTTLLVSLLTALVIAAAAPLLVGVVFGAAFQPALVPLWLILPGAVALSLDKPIAAFQLGQGRPEVSLYVTGLATPVTVVAYVVLIPALGLVGAALASTISYTLTTALDLYFLQRVSSLRWRHVLIPRAGDLAAYRAVLGHAGRRLRAVAS